MLAFAFAAVVSANNYQAEPTDTYCYTAAFSTTPSQLNRLVGTGKSLDNSKMYASGSATVTWNKTENTYGVKMDGLNYPAGNTCTMDQIKTGTAEKGCNPLIAAHLHSGNSTSNGPASVVFCMGPGLPTHAKVDSIFDDKNDPLFGLCPVRAWAWDLEDKFFNPDVVAATGPSLTGSGAEPRVGPPPDGVRGRAPGGTSLTGSGADFLRTRLQKGKKGCMGAKTESHK